MLYGGPIQEVEWRHVEEFCRERIPEGASIDYKADWPTDLAKTIAAMANTLGGLILIGVATDEQEIPQTPLAGIVTQDRLELRVFDVCQGSIFPPVIPEVRACANADGTRSVVVVRVPINRQAHAVDKNTRVYVRTGNRNSHTELADVSKIEWLLGLRGSLERQRSQIIQRSQERYQAMIRSEIGRTRGAVRANFFNRHWLEMYAVPTFPSVILSADATALRRMATEVVRHGEAVPGCTFPWSAHEGRGRYIQGGYCMAAFVNQPPPLGCYHEVNEFGLFYLRERIVREHGILENMSVLWMEILASRLHSFLVSSSRLYAELQYRGPIELHFALQGIDGLADLRVVPRNTTLAVAQQHSWCPDSDIVIPLSANTLDLDDELIDIVVEVGGRFDMAFGIAPNDANLRQYLTADDRSLRPGRHTA